MIVSDLIKELEKLPKDMFVVGRGYESGYNDIDEVDIQTLVRCDNDWYDGEYQEPSSFSGKPIDLPEKYICLT